MIPRTIRIIVRAFVPGLLVVLSGCQPFLMYEHISDPRVANDGYDFACAGLELEHGMLTVTAAACENFARSGDGTYGRASVTLRFPRAPAANP